MTTGKGGSPYWLFQSRYRDSVDIDMASEVRKNLLKLGHSMTSKDPKRPKALSRIIVCH